VTDEEGEHEVCHLDDNPLDNDIEIEEQESLSMSVDQDNDMHPNHDDDSNDDINEMSDIPNLVMFIQFMKIFFFFL
jgi:hypothetical protein